MTRVTITSPSRARSSACSTALATIPTTWATRAGHHPIRFRDPATGQTWTGRGLRPGRQINEFEVKE